MEVVIRLIIIEHGIRQGRRRRLQILLIWSNGYSGRRLAATVLCFSNSRVPRNLLLKRYFKQAHLLLDLGKLELGGGIQRRRQKHAVSIASLAVDAWMRLVALELATPTFQARCDHAIPPADLGRRRRWAGGVGHGVACPQCSQGCNEALMLKVKAK